jgi:S-adenosylmethionine synthetase
VNIKDFCPISLVGSIYKIISKVVANRLKLELERVISKSQNVLSGGDKF